jgi:hypothetical protein
MVQRKLPKGFSGQVGYVATRQVRQLGFIDLNVVRVGGGNNSRPLVSTFGRTARTAILDSVGGTHYDSLQATLDRRFADGFSLQASYTWSKAIGAMPGSNSDNEPPIKIPEFYNLNRSLLDIDRPHNLHIANVFEMPFGPGKKWLSNGFAGNILGGWQFNSILSFQSGVPFSVTASGTSLNASGNTQRADQVKSDVQILGGTGRGQSWFDPFAFKPVTEARFGTVGFNTLRGPRYANWDFGIFRDFRLTEQHHVQFRVEAFNFTNTPHFSNPGNNVSNMVLNSDGTIRSLGGYTEITSTRGTGREGIDERQFRFGLRWAF